MRENVALTKQIYAVLNQTDHAEQFTWLESVLVNARAQSEKVYVIGHKVPTDYFKKCTEWYYRLAVEYPLFLLSLYPFAQFYYPTFFSFLLPLTL